MSGRHNPQGVLRGIDSFALTVRSERCVQVRNRNADCMRCAEVCTSGCITVDEGALAVDPERCVGCGTCATVCPTCALEARNPNDAQLLAAAKAAVREGSVCVACQPVRAALGGLVDEDAVAPVVCLGRVEETLVAGLAAAGVTRVDLAAGDCVHCAQRAGRDCARMVAQSANGLLAAWEHPCRAELAPRVPAYALAAGASADDAQAAIEAYFREERACVPVRAQVTVAESDEPASAGESAPEAPAAFASSAVAEDSVEPASRFARVMADGTLPHFLPDRRERLLNALYALGEPKAPTVSTRLWGMVAIDGTKCSSCRMCATFCPTGSLRRFGEDEGEGSEFGVEHFPGDCVKCGTCRAICPEGAILLLDDVKPSYLFDGDVHRYRMRSRAVKMNDPHQILNTMKSQIEGDVFER